MASLKDLRVRINSVKSTRKITSAMKMVAASKLRRAQEAAEAGRPYAERMERMLGNLAASMQGQAGAPALMAGTGKDDTHLLVVMTANRGLCGGFNGNVVREARRTIAKLTAQGKTVKVLCIGRKGRDLLKRDYSKLIVQTFDGLGRKGITFPEADSVGTTILEMFEKGEFDVCTILYNKFQSAMTQIVTPRQIIPFPIPEGDVDSGVGNALYEYEPSEEGILKDLLPRNVSMQIFSCLLESDASEQGARMTAMDSATRNAGDMLDKLTLTYNRTRQAAITKELIEIISGAEAL